MAPGVGGRETVRYEGELSQAGVIRCRQGGSRTVARKRELMPEWCSVKRQVQRGSVLATDGHWPGGGCQEVTATALVIQSLVSKSLRPCELPQP